MSRRIKEGKVEVVSPQLDMKRKSETHRHSLGRSKAEAIFPSPPPLAEVPKNYAVLLTDLKGRIQRERIKAVLSANAGMTLLYWDIGRAILQSQKNEGWGAKVIDRLAFDLSKAFPDMRGFSPRNLKYMRAFATAWPDKAIVQQAAAQIPWFHNCLLLEKVSDPKVRTWYIQQALKNGWSRSILEIQIEQALHKRQGRLAHNFKGTLPPSQSDMAAQVFKDPYLFDFIGTTDPRREREVEQALVDHIQRFLLELGNGFAFVGRQVKLEVGNQDFRIDLLFYHLRLRAYVVVELKAVPFDPAFVGQINLYLSAVDDLLKHPDDKPTIGLLLCKEKDHVVVEYALRNLKRPIGVARWETHLTKSLPSELKGTLPTIKELEAELDKG